MSCCPPSYLGLTQLGRPISLILRHSAPQGANAGFIIARHFSGLTCTAATPATTASAAAATAPAVAPATSPAAAPAASPIAAPAVIPTGVSAPAPNLSQVGSLIERNPCPCPCPPSPPPNVPICCTSSWGWALPPLRHHRCRCRPCRCTSSLKMNALSKCSRRPRPPTAEVPPSPQTQPYLLPVVAWDERQTGGEWSRSHSLWGPPFVS